MARSPIRVFLGLMALALVAGCPHKERLEPVYDDGSVREPGPEKPLTAADLQVSDSLGDFEVLRSE